MGPPFEVDSSEDMLVEEQVANMLLHQRYNPAIIPRLEEYVDHQLQKEKYDYDANMGLLKLYQFHPEKSNSKKIVQIMAKAMLALPAQDFLSGLYLVPQQSLSQEPMATLVELVSLLETCMFELFWQRLAGIDSLRKTIVGFDDAVRRFILDVVARTYSSIRLDLLGQLLNASTEDTTSAVLKFGWAVEGDVATIPPNTENTAKPSNDRGEQLGFAVIASSRSIM
ncbi:Eukaryotic translation initiation factor 3 subunit K [Porphyridium purpureum]|uniref:Eukaryotic translation initiation factor 3 subunit K n=1 Tax=Porphyridium purpureum TaxID=35688 RepID=A0A5J4YQF4_PORPP|nr:Eukaryotic translation initiation factor 3 subunit K [Porphyridium purpureum]|eukprot:POR0571..scf236_6